MKHSTTTSNMSTESVCHWCKWKRRA